MLERGHVPERAARKHLAVVEDGASTDVDIGVLRHGTHQPLNAGEIERILAAELRDLALPNAPTLAVGHITQQCHYTRAPGTRGSPPST